MPYIPRTQITAAVAGAGGDVLAAPSATGRWYRPTWTDSTAGAGSTTLENMSAVRLFLEAGTLDRIAAQHFASPTGGETCRLGIYNDDGNNRPSSLVVDAGTIDLSTAAALKTITISQVITTGWYWLASVRQGGSVTATMVTYPSNSQGGANTGSWVEFDGTTDIHTETNVMAERSAISGALPDPFAATLMSAMGAVTVVGVRYA